MPETNNEINLVIFRGYGTPQRLFFSGRALRNAPDVAVAGASTLQNLLASLNRIDSKELAGVIVRAVHRGEVWETTSDAEGYFEFTLEPSSRPDPNQMWHEVAVSWVDPAEDRSSLPMIVQILLPPPTSCFGVISDIDDTILASHITSPARMAVEMLLKNAYTRTTFPGVPEFYQALQAGASGHANNPVFYVSLSPWNLYSLIDEFLTLNDFPVGPVLLRDYGLQMLVSLGQPSAKYKVIQELLETYPELPFVLLGDSGQQDAENYIEIACSNPGRVLAIYIRDVSEGEDQERCAAIEALASKMVGSGVDLVLSHKTADFADHAAANGLIIPGILAVRPEDA